MIPAMRQTIGPMLALSVTTMLLTGCGKSNSASPNSAQALAYADAINLRAADVPGLEEGRRPAKRQTAAGPFGRQLDRCESAAARAGLVIGISSPRFDHLSSLPLQGVGSGVYFFKSEALAHQYLAAPNTAGFAACLETVVSNEPKTVTCEGSKVAQPMSSDPHLSTLPASLPLFTVSPRTSTSPGSGVRTYGLQLTAHPACGRRGGSENYEDFLSFVMGDAVITLNAFSQAHPLPAASERRLIALLYSRAEAHNKSSSPQKHTGPSGGPTSASSRIRLVYRAQAGSQPVTASSLEATIGIMRKRVEGLGVAQPEIQRSGTDKIVVALPDASNATRAHEVVGMTAQLYFYDWEPNVIGPAGKPAPSERTVTGGPNTGAAQFGLPEYQAVLRAAKRTAIIRSNDTTLDPGCTPAQIGGCRYGVWYLLDTKHEKVLRTCFEMLFSVFLGGPWFWSGWWGEAVEHETDHRYVNHRFVGLGQALVVTDQAPPAQQPGERSLNYPSAGKDREADLLGWFLDDFHDDSPRTLGEIQERALVAAVGEDVTHRAERSVQALEDALATVAVWHGGGGDHHDQHQADRVDHDMALAAVDLLARVKTAARRADGVRALDRLRVHDPRRRLCAATLADTHLLTQLVVQRLQRAVVTPVTKIPIYGLPRREVLRQHPPRPTSTHVIKDRVDDLPLIVNSRAARRPRRRIRQQRPHKLPLPIRQIRGVPTHE